MITENPCPCIIQQKIDEATFTDRGVVRDDKEREVLDVAASDIIEGRQDALDWAVKRTRESLTEPQYSALGDKRLRQAVEFAAHEYVD